jgi:putative ABC transport system permease protein
VRSTTLNRESPALYYPMASRVWPTMDVVVRTSGSPKNTLPVIRERVHALDSHLALVNERTMEEWLSNSSAQPRLNTVLLGVFAFVALLIASIGIYGVLAYTVSQRTSEIGVRMALGATPRGVLRLIVSEGMTVVLIGIGIGILAGLALGRTVASQMFGVHWWNPATFLGVSIALAVVALAACVIPALRASRVNPIVALRYE